MAMNIKNKEVHELAALLAREEGKSITQVVLEALRERKEELERKSMRSQADAAVKDLQRALQGRILCIEDLYDPETGLPR